MNVAKKIEEVSGELKAAQKSLVELMSSASFGTDQLASLTSDIATLKGKLDALDFIAVRRAAPRIADASIAEQLVCIVMRGADDSWSGRGNEIRRCRFDGFRMITESFRDHLRYSK